MHFIIIEKLQKGTSSFPQSNALLTMQVADVVKLDSREDGPFGQVTTDLQPYHKRPTCNIETEQQSEIKCKRLV